PDTAPPAQPEVALVQIPTAAWDANRGAAGAQVPPTAAAPVPPPPAPAPPPPQPKEQMQHQVVETAPGNNQRPEDSKLAAESDNSHKNHTITKKRKHTDPVTQPRRREGKSETTKPAMPAPGAAISDSQQQEAREAKPELGQKAEMPTTKRRDELALRDDPH